MWKAHGTCAGFDSQAAYFDFALAAAAKYNADVSLPRFPAFCTLATQRQQMWPECRPACSATCAP